jgi:hypothetical protein
MARGRNVSVNSTPNSPFQSPRANLKHAYHQVNGETRKSQNEIIMHGLKKRGGHS